MWVAKQHTQILEYGLCYITFLIKEEKKEKLPLGWIFLVFLTSYKNTTILYDFYKTKFQKKKGGGGGGYPLSR
jgi:hydroxyacyl-ACP dehydratase HTD2-like protein with hotdog domain